MAILLSVCVCDVPNPKYFKMIFLHKKTSLCHQVSGTKKDCGTTQIDVRETFPQYIPLRQYDSQTKMIGRYASTKTLTAPSPSPGVPPPATHQSCDRNMSLFQPLNVSPYSFLSFIILILRLRESACLIVRILNNYNAASRFQREAWNAMGT